MSSVERVTDGAFEPSLARVGRRIDTVEGDLERAVCESLYNASGQRRQRLLITLMLGVKHTLRGIIFSWPLYLVGIAACILPDNGSLWLGVFLVPALTVSFVILRRGVVEDYRHFLHRVLLKAGAARHILWPRD